MSSTKLLLKQAETRYAYVDIALASKAAAMPPQYPAGEFQLHAKYDADIRQQLQIDIAEAPARLRAATSDLPEELLDTKFRNWTLRQITHHIPDSHLNSLIRFKWALTEDRPTIKAYDEAAWVGLPDARFGQIQPALLIMDGIHAKWTQLLEAMTPEQFSRTFFHPEAKTEVSLWECLNYYAWHSKHHIAQIHWVREKTTG